MVSTAYWLVFKGTDGQGFGREGEDFVVYVYWITVVFCEKRLCMDICSNRIQ